MGRNGAGKTTLLRAAAGAVEPARGAARAPAGCALLPQSPTDLLVRERVADELPGDAGRRALEQVGLGWAGESDPRDLSGGERERLALALVMAGREQGGLPGLICLDEPTRGMDAARKLALCGWLSELAHGGSAVLVATHDVEFAARLASRVVLLGDGELIADGPADEILSGGWYFATEVARILGAAGAITPEAGAELLRAPAAAGETGGGGPVSWQVVVFAGLGLVLAGGFWWYERSRPSARLVALVAALAALAVAGRLVLTPIPNVVATTDIASDHRLRPRRRARVRGRGAGGADLEHLAWAGAVDGLGDGRLGAGGARRRLARRGDPATARAARARGRLRACRLRLRCAPRPLGDGHLRRRAIAGSLPGPLGARDPVQRRPRDRKLPHRARRRPGAGADDLPLPRAVRVHLAPGDRDPAVARGGAGRGSGGERGADSRAGRFVVGVVARALPGFRRRLRRHPRSAVEPGDDRLGDARARGGRDQPAGPRARRREPGLLSARRDRPAAVGRRPRAHDPRARRGRRRPAPLRRPRPGLRAALAPRRRRLGGRPGQPHGVLRAGDARRRRRPLVAPPLGGLAATGAERGRRLGDSAAGPERVRLDRRVSCRAWSPPGTAASRPRAA